MVDEGIKRLFIGFALVGLFFLSLTMFAGNFANENTTKTRLEKGDPKEESGYFSLSAMWQSLKDISGITTGTANTVFGVVKKEIGIPGIVIGVIIAIIIVALLLYVWRAYKTGQ